MPRTLEERLIAELAALSERVRHLEVSESPLGALDAASLQGVAVAMAAPANGQMLVYNSSTSAWEPAGTLPALTVSGPLAFGQTLKTIAGGAFTATSNYHRVDTEGAAATDDLDTINGGVVGMLLVLQSQANTRVVTVRDNAGNIQLAGSANFALNNIFDKLMLIYTPGNRWEELCRTDNG